MSEGNSAEKHVEIGVVGRPHGVRGAVHVFLHNPASEILEGIQSVVLVAGGAGARTYRLADVRRAGKGSIVAFAGVERREEAEKLTGARVQVPRSAFPRLEAGEYYVADLMGLEVSAEGRRIGTVVESRSQGGVEVLTVRGEGYDLEVPLVVDYVVAIDVAAGRLEIRGAEDLPRTAHAARRDARA